MTLVGDLVCDRCRTIAVDEHASDMPLPDDWLPVGYAGHACPGCVTREEREWLAAVLAAVGRAFEQVGRTDSQEAA